MGELKRQHQQGFTLVEMIIVITLSSIVVTMITAIMARPINQYVDMARRAELVDVAESALRIMARDVRSALPNSIRVSVSGNRRALEMVNTIDGGRYRSKGERAIDVPQETDSFDVLGHVASPLSGAERIVVYNLGALDTSGNPLAGANVYGTASSGGAHVISSTATVSSGADFDTINLSSAFQFSFPSPEKRFFIVDTPISYVCDLTEGTIRRYSTYSLVSAQPTNPAVSPLSGSGVNKALLTEHVENCAFSYQPHNARQGLLSLQLSLTLDGERITLLHQISVDNAP